MVAGDSKRSILDHVCTFRSRLRRACELALSNLATAQSRMKGWFDRKASSRNFSPGDKVLVLLPIPGSSLQAQYSGPYEVVKRVGARDYVIGTPDQRHKTQLCHVNMLKQYHEQEHVRVDGEELCPSILSKPVLAVEGLPPDTGGDVGEARLSVAVTQGKLCNSGALESLPLRLSHLSGSQRDDLLALVGSNGSMFSDVPSKTSLLQHDIDVVGAAPIKQHLYRVNPDKRQRLSGQVDYMLQHAIAEPSCSPWSSPCLLATKANGEDRFCMDFRKVNAVTKADCYPLPRMEDCVDHVGSASFVSKLDLLKGYWQVPLLLNSLQKLIQYLWVGVLGTSPPPPPVEYCTYLSVPLQAVAGSQESRG